MARTRFIIVLLTIVVIAGLGVAIGSLAGGADEPKAPWTPPSGVEATATMPPSGIAVPTLIPVESPVASPAASPVASPAASPVGS